MKRLCVILSIITLLFVACSKPQPEPVIAEPEPLPFEFDENLQNIDTLLQHNAATALQELLSFRAPQERGTSSNINAHYQALLTSEALYKTDNPQNFNRYAYCLNNPLKYTDPSGEIFWAPIILGATIGAYMGGTIANNDYNPLQWDYDSGKTWGYMLGGAIVGGISGYIGGAIAASEIPMANTLGIMASSYTYSLGTNLYTNGQTDTSISFGFASYNFTSDEFGYLGKKGNSTLENIGYGLGALANISDILAGMKPGNVTLRTENNPNYSSKGDYIGHSQITMGNNVIIDWGPTEYKTSLLGLIEGTNSYENGRLIENMKGISFWNPIDVHGVNIKRILKFSDYLNKGGHYNLLYNNCVSMTSRALNISGVFNIGIHPYILHTQMYLRSLGLRPALFSYFILNIKQP